MAFGKGKGESSRRTKYTVGAVLLVVIVGATAAIVIWQTTDAKDETEYTLCKPSATQMGVYEKAAIVADAPECAEVGKDMLQKEGTVADAAVAAILCMGAMHPFSSGIGGGFLMVMYNATTKESMVINAREVAPGNATEDMFEGNEQASARGPLAVAVPGEMKGLMALHRKHGVLPWEVVLQPAIDLCENGIRVSASFANAMNEHKERIRNTTSMKEILWNEETDDIYKENEIMTRPQLAKTLRTIAEDRDREDYYTGEIMRNFVRDLKELGGIIEEEDMLNYSISEVEPLKVELEGGYTLHAVPPPGSGILVAYMLQLLTQYLPVPSTSDLATSITTYQRMAEAFKHTYAQRTKLGDPFDEDIRSIVEELVFNMTNPQYIAEIREKISDDLTHNDYEFYGAEYYQPEDHGTAHISIIAENGDAIAVTSTVNLYFGALIRSSSTGIIYNDEMDDFSAPGIVNNFGVPPSPNNFIKPGKRPMSSMSPSIFTDREGRVRLVVGGAGGTTITTSVAQIAMRNLWFGASIKEAVDSFRIHHQLYPMELRHEECMPEEIALGLSKKNHTLDGKSGTIGVASGVARREDNKIFANNDHRKAGSIAGF